MEIPKIAVIYRLEIAGHYYVGSTCQGLDTRITQHKEALDEGDERKLYAFIRENGGWDAVRVTAIETWIVAKDREEVRIKEQSYICLEDHLCLNTLAAWRDVKAKVKEYYEAHKEEIIAYRVEWGRQKRAAIRADPVAHAAAKERRNARQRAYRAKKKAAASATSDSSDE